MTIITVPNEVAKVMFLQVCVCPWGGGGYPGMPCRWYPSMPCSRSRGGGIPACLAGGIPACLAAGLQGGVPALGGGFLLPGGGGACSWGCGGDPLASRRLLLRTVRILLECILVLIIILVLCDRLLFFILKGGQLKRGKVRDKVN